MPHDEHEHRERIRIDLHIHGAVDPVLAAIATLSARVDQLGANIMASLDEVLTDVKDESTQIDALSTLTAGLKQQLADALAGVSLPPDVQAKVDAVFAGVEANKAKVVAAINTNTAAANVPVPGA